MSDDTIYRQEALDALKAYLTFADWKPSVKEILEMAVNDTTDILGRLPSAQPESKREWYMHGYRDAQPRWIPCEDCEKRCEKWENSKT